METTSRRLASARRFLARSPSLISFSSCARSSAGMASPSFAMRSVASLPFCIRSASVTSSSGDSRSTLPISFRYMRTGSSMANVSAMAEVSTSSSSGTSSTSSGSKESSSSPMTFSSTPFVSTSMPMVSSVSYTLSMSSLDSSKWLSASEISLRVSRPFFLPSASRSRRICCCAACCSCAFAAAFAFAFVISFVLPRFVF